jgi:DNA polymerase-3 subunit delta
VTPETALREAAEGKLKPVYLLLGEEVYFRSQVTSALREASTRGGVPGFNDDRFIAGDLKPDQAKTVVLAACRQLPMMAARRFVLVQQLERWERKGDDAEGDELGADAVKSVLDAFAEYAKEPASSTVLVLSASKLHAQRKLVTLAKKADFVVSCESLRRDRMPRFLQEQAKARGVSLPTDVAEQVAEALGPDAAAGVEAVERLSLFVGPGGTIDERAARELVTRTAQSDVFNLLGALGEGQLGRALRMLDDSISAGDAPLATVGALAWGVRCLLKLDAGDVDPPRMHPSSRDAMTRIVRSAPRGTAAKWHGLLAEADLALKSSRRPPQAILEQTLVDMHAAMGRAR